MDRKSVLDLTPLTRFAAVIFRSAPTYRAYDHRESNAELHTDDGFPWLRRLRRHKQLSSLAWARPQTTFLSSEDWRSARGKLGLVHRDDRGCCTQAGGTFATSCTFYQRSFLDCRSAVLFDLVSPIPA